ncbi:MAG: pilus assembly protein TadG-related protein [Sporichthyaceae bacterium]
MTATQPEPRPRDEGSATLFVVVLAAALLAAAGLVVDGGYALAARQEAAATAEQAARAGADALARDGLRGTGPVRLDPAAASAAAHAYLAATGHTGTVTVSGQAVGVSVRITRRTAILSAVGIDTVSSAASATAVGLSGIDRPDPALTGAAYGTGPTDPDREAAR